MSYPDELDSLNFPFPPKEALFPIVPAEPMAKEPPPIGRSDYIIWRFMGFEEPPQALIDFPTDQPGSFKQRNMNYVPQPAGHDNALPEVIGESEALDALSTIWRRKNTKATIVYIRDLIRTAQLYEAVDQDEEAKRKIELVQQWLGSAIAYSESNSL